MKIKFFILLSLSLGFVLFSCKKYNPEDPWFSHGGKHLNDRLDGEWELVSLHINQQVMSTFSENDVYEDYSNLLDVDTMNIAKFFKFVPTKKINKLEGEGDLFIRTKSMISYPEKVGISLPFLHDLNDTNVGLAKLTYKFREGSKSPDFFKFDAKDVDTVDFLTSNDAVFKPFDEYFVFNNFFYRYFYNFQIIKATKKELILYRSICLNPELAKEATYRRYRLTFKKIN